MANIKTTQKEWDKAREYFEAGLPLSAIVEKTGISKSAISKKSNAEGWSKETQKKQLIADAVRVASAKETLNETALEVHNEIVSDRTRAIMFFGDAAIKNVQEAMLLRCDNQNDFKARADTIIKGKEAVLGKTPDTAIQINNTKENTEIDITPANADEARKLYESITNRRNV